MEGCLVFPFLPIFSHSPLIPVDFLRSTRGQVCVDKDTNAYSVEVGTRRGQVRETNLSRLLTCIRASAACFITLLFPPELEVRDISCQHESLPMALLPEPFLARAARVTERQSRSQITADFI